MGRLSELSEETVEVRKTVTRTVGTLTVSAKEVEEAVRLWVTTSLAGELPPTFEIVGAEAVITGYDWESFDGFEVKLAVNGPVSGE